MITGPNAMEAPAQPNLHVQEVIQRAAEQLQDLLRQRADVMRRIAAVRQTVLGLARLFGENEMPPELARILGYSKLRKQPGFTRACRVVLMEAKSPIEAKQACQELRSRFPELYARHKNPLASVTTVFTRLAKYKQAESVISQDGRRVWRWIADETIAAEFSDSEQSLGSGTDPMDSETTEGGLI